MIQTETPLSSVPHILAAKSYLQSLLPPSFVPSVGIIGGSGLSALEDVIASFGSDAGSNFDSKVESKRVEIGFEKIPGFPVSTVPGHAGKLLFGTLVTKCQRKVNAVVMSGRAHLYEGYNLKTATFPVRVFGAMGLKTLIVTNAAGGLNKTYEVGDIMVINDHISLPSLCGSGNPLSGPLETPPSAGPGIGGPRFLALSDAYDLELRRAAWSAWDKLSESSSESETSVTSTTKDVKNRQLREGVYAFVGGPSYETPAEARFLSILGADVVGMSTVPEVTVARHVGLRVLGLCLVTNKVTMEKVPLAKSSDIAASENKVCHEEVIAEGRIAAELMKRLILEIVRLEVEAR
ncbi:hypothetical protein K3495_g3004 [Podosphaera aphanis]|nr:hypothetical protein K3495_g3004 [Podosphaera aphanis]